MEGDEIERQASKFQKISCNGGDGGGNGGRGVGRLCGWPSSRIVRVSRVSGGKDRHSKVLTSKGLRDRRIRLSVTTAIEFYDLQDRLGYDQPSKAVDWLIKAAASSIDELPSLDPSFHGADDRQNHHQQPSDGLNFENPNHQHQQNSNSNNNNNLSLSKSSVGSSTSNTSKGSRLSLSRSETRIRARERARDLTAKKEKKKESVLVTNTVNSSFTDLLTAEITTTTTSNNSNPASGMDYSQMQQFNIPTGIQNFAPVVGDGGGIGENYNLNFSIGSSSSLSSSSHGGLYRGTLQSNLLYTMPHHHHLQRFHPASMADGSASANFPFIIAPDQFQATGYGGGRHSDYYKGKSKN